MYTLVCRKLEGLCVLEEKLKRGCKVRVNLTQSKRDGSIQEVGVHLYTVCSRDNRKPYHVHSLVPTGPDNKKDKLLGKPDCLLQEALVEFKIKWSFCG